MSEGRDPSSGLVGTILAGRYRIVELLGEGAMGAVYLGEHVKMGRRDAIKVLRDSLATDREATLRFLRGARNVSSILHPNVCTIYDFSDTADGLQFMAMEFVPGETLKDLLDREGRLPLERAIHIAVQTADALQAAHDAGIVHRDLKPGNIMLMPARDGRDHVKVVDFDIAKGADTDGEEVTRLGFVVGTPEYMSPEQLMGEHLDGRSDVYSLALVLFRMLAGSLPFRAETTQDVMIQRLTHAPLRLVEALPEGEFPERLQHAIGRALERRVTDRWPNAVEFGREMTAAIAEPNTGWAAPVPVPMPANSAELPATRIAPAAAAPVATHAVTLPPAPSANGKRNLAIVAALVIVLAIAAGAVLLNRGGVVNGTGERDDTGVSTVDGDGDEVAGVPQDTLQGAVPVGPAGGDMQPRGDTGGSGAGPGAGGTPPPSPPPDAAPSIAISADRAEDDLFQLIDRFPPMAERAPPPNALEAMIDTALAFWTHAAVLRKDHALAAHVLAMSYEALSDWRRCVAWYDSAISMNPAHSEYPILRARCQSQIR